MNQHLRRQGAGDEEALQLLARLAAYAPYVAYLRCPVELQSQLRHEGRESTEDRELQREVLKAEGVDDECESVNQQGQLPNL